MTIARLGVALRAVVYMAGFVLGWVALAVPAFLLFHAFVVLYEEPTLRSRFGDSYAAYVARVNRWVPKPPGREGSLRG